MPRIKDDEARFLQAAKTAGANANASAIAKAAKVNKRSVKMFARRYLAPKKKPQPQPPAVVEVTSEQEETDAEIQRLEGSDVGGEAGRADHPRRAHYVRRPRSGK